MTNDQSNAANVLEISLDLIRQVLIKHETAVIAEFRSIIEAKNHELRLVYAERDELKKRHEPPSGFERSKQASESTRLLERLADDGGRYLLSIGLSKEEINDGQTPTYGWKSTSRWLTDGEYRAIFSGLVWLENESMPPSQREPLQEPLGQESAKLVGGE